MPRDDLVVLFSGLGHRVVRTALGVRPGPAGPVARQEFEAVAESKRVSEEVATDLGDARALRLEVEGLRSRGAAQGGLP